METNLNTPNFQCCPASGHHKRCSWEIFSYRSYFVPRLLRADADVRAVHDNDMIPEHSPLQAGN